MNPKVFFGLAILGCVLSSATALLGTFAAVGAGSGTALSFTALGSATTTTGFLTASGAAVLGGAVLLKGLALVAVASELSRGRGKRSAESLTAETDIAIAALAQNEPAQCYRRLICDLASGQMEKSENDVILSLFETEVAESSPRFDFVTARKIGKMARNTQVCEFRFSCPLTGSQIQKIFKQL